MRVQLVLDVSRLHDTCHLKERLVMGEPLLDKSRKGTAALPVAVWISGARGVETDGSAGGLPRSDLFRWHEEEFGLRIEEAADEPASGSSVDLYSCACDPFNGYASRTRRLYWSKLSCLRTVVRFTVSTGPSLVNHQLTNRHPPISHLNNCARPNPISPPRSATHSASALNR